MSSKISFIVNGEEYVFENVEDIPAFINKSLNWYYMYITRQLEEEEDFDAQEIRQETAHACIVMFDLLLPSIPEEIFDFVKFFPIPPYFIRHDNKPMQDLLTSEMRDFLIKTCFSQFFRACIFLSRTKGYKALAKISYHAKLEVLEEIFANEINSEKFVRFLYSVVIKNIVLGVAFIYIVLERQCSSLKKYLIEKDVVRHIINLQKLNETQDTFQLEANEWISKRATLICEKYFCRPIIDGSLYNVREEFKYATKLFEEGSYVDAINQLKKHITTPGYGVHEMLSSRIIDSLLSYFLPSNKTEGFNRAKIFLEVILSQNEDDVEEKTKSKTVVSMLIMNLVKCLLILLQRVDKDPERYEAMEKCQHKIEEVCYLSYHVMENKNYLRAGKCGDIKNVNDLSEIIEKVMILPDANDLDSDTCMETLRNCPMIDKKDDSSVNVYNYCNLMKVGQLLNVLHSINNQWGTLMKIDDFKPLLPGKTFVSINMAKMPYRHDPWFYWKIIKKCRFLLSHRRRVRLFLRYEMGIQFVKNEDTQNRIQVQFDEDEDVAYENVEYENVTNEYIRELLDDEVTYEQYRRNDYAELLNSDKWFESEELDHSSYFLHVVSRENILEDVTRIFSKNPDYKAYWVFKFLHESGSGHGLTKEFYMLFSKDAQKMGIGHWLGNPAGPHKHPDFISNGFFPSPLTCLMTEENEDSTMYFTILGKMLAKSLLDLQIMDIPFNRVLIKWLLSDHSGKRYIEVDDLKCIIPMQSDFIDQLIDVIKQKREIQSKYSQNPEMLNEALDSLTLGGCNFEDWCLNFTLPLFPEMEMKEGGAAVLLSSQNVEEYLRLLMYYFFVKGPRRILKIIKDGFESVAPLSFLKVFYFEELETLLCSNEFQPWTMSELKKNIYSFIHYTNPVPYLFEVLSSFNSEEQGMFLKFVTSYSKLPPGGFEALNKRISIDVLNVENPDHYLPVSSTCTNSLMLPQYSSVEITREKLLMAIREAGNSFHRENNLIR